MQRTRRSNPYPFTWEIPVMAGAGVLFLLLLGVQTGRSVANLVAGDGWVFVDRAALFSSLGGILGGHAGSGLTHVTQPASPALMWTGIGVVEVLVVAGSVGALVWWLDRWGPGRVYGVATRAEAEALLGRARLRRHAAVIRPDLHGRAVRAGRDGVRPLRRDRGRGYGLEGDPAGGGGRTGPVAPGLTGGADRRLADSPLPSSRSSRSSGSSRPTSGPETVEIPVQGDVGSWA